jgi:FAD/FMN-containing dehydrogenase
MPPTLHGAFLGLEDKPHCYVGGYPEYVVNVSTVAQVQLAVNFARERNIRLVIKNTGHDFGAKSVGKGGLSVWTHYLKDAEYYANYEVGSYKGPAVKLGAGIQVFETNALAKKHDITLVGGEGRVSSNNVDSMKHH